MTERGQKDPHGGMRVLVILSLAELLAMSLWFSATAVIPALTAEWHLGAGDQAWLTMSVQCGFVVGTLLSAVLTLSDVFSARKVFAVSAVLGALANSAIPLFATGLESALVFRFLTGVCLAGVYPPGMKIMATWFKRGRGMAIGALVGALTIGSASPHLLNLIGTPDWRTLMMTASASSVLAAALCSLFVSSGPYDTGKSVFDWRFAGRALRDRGVRLVNFGYLGHQWELYAMWTWLPAFLLASFEASGTSASSALASSGAFGAIAVGGVSCVLAGIAADRVGAQVDRDPLTPREWQLLSPCWTALRRATGSASGRMCSLGVRHHCRLRAVFGECDRADRTGLHRHHPHPADLSRISSDPRFDSPHSRSRRARWMGMGIRCTGPGTRPRHHCHVSAGPEGTESTAAGIATVTPSADFERLAQGCALDLPPA